MLFLLYIPYITIPKNADVIMRIIGDGFFLLIFFNTKDNKVIIAKIIIAL